MTGSVLQGRRFPYIYKPPKNLLKLTTRELPPKLEPVLFRLVRLWEGVEVVEDMRVARSSYLAWDSRGSWPKRLKANGAAVEVGNRENEEEEVIEEGEDDILFILWFWLVVRWVC